MNSLTNPTELRYWFSTNPQPSTKKEKRSKKERKLLLLSPLLVHPLRDWHLIPIRGKE
jgi:hypothetical protein